MTVVASNFARSPNERHDVRTERSRKSIQPHTISIASICSHVSKGSCRFIRMVRDHPFSRGRLSNTETRKETNDHYGETPVSKAHAFSLHSEWRLKCDVSGLAK